MRKADAPAFGDGSKRAWLTRPGRIEVRRRCFHCRSCGKGRFPLDRAPGLEGSAFTPGMAGVMAGTVPVTGFGAAARHVADPAGVKASPGPPRRRSPAPGEAALRSGREKAVEKSAPEPRMHLSVGGTGIPMRK